MFLRQEEFGQPGVSGMAALYRATAECDNADEVVIRIWNVPEVTRKKNDATSSSARFTVIY